MFFVQRLLSAKLTPGGKVCAATRNQNCLQAPATATSKMPLVATLLTIVIQLFCTLHTRAYVRPVNGAAGTYTLLVALARNSWRKVADIRQSMHNCNLPLIVCQHLLRDFKGMHSCLQGHCHANTGSISVPTPLGTTVHKLVTLRCQARVATCSKASSSKCSCYFLALFLELPKCHAGQLVWCSFFSPNKGCCAF